MASMRDENRLKFQDGPQFRRGNGLEENADVRVFCGGSNTVSYWKETGRPGRCRNWRGYVCRQHPEKFEEIWHRMPEYIEKGSKFVDMASGFLERIGQEKGGYRHMPVAGGTRY